MTLRLNIKENSIRKKRGTSFFESQPLQELEEAPTLNQLASMIDQSKFIRKGENVKMEPGSSIELNSGFAIGSQRAL